MMVSKLSSGIIVASPVSGAFATHGQVISRRSRTISWEFRRPDGIPRCTVSLHNENPCRRFAVAGHTMS